MVKLSWARCPSRRHVGNLAGFTARLRIVTVKYGRDYIVATTHKTFVVNGEQYSHASADTDVHHTLAQVSELKKHNPQRKK